MTGDALWQSQMCACNFQKNKHKNLLYHSKARQAVRMADTAISLLARGCHIEFEVDDVPVQHHVVLALCHTCRS